jgi:hypothetical protein
LHYEALNKAIEEVVGLDYIIDRTEHLTIYDGLSTNQKLTLLMQMKDMPVEHSPEVCSCYTLVKPLFTPLYRLFTPL